MAAVGANGNLYPCHQMSGYYEQHGWCLGNVKTDGLQKCLREGDYLKAKVKDTAKGYFDIEETFIRFVVEDCRTQIGYQETMACLIYKNANTMVWLNDLGTPLYSRLSDDYQLGAHAYLQITEYCVGNMYGKINTQIVERADASGDPIVPNEVQRDTIVAFADSADVPAEEKKEEPAKEVK